MILNGKEIVRFHSLRSPGVFSLPAFFRQRDEFLDTVRESPFFFSTAEQGLGKVLCNCLDRKTSDPEYQLKEDGVVWGKDDKGKYSIKVAGLEETLCGKYERLKKSVPVKLCLAVVVLYQLLGKDFEDDLDVEECLRVLKTRNNDLGGFCICCDKDLVLQELQELAYPLEAKVLVNVSDAPVGVTFGGETVYLKALECMAGVFHGQKCYKLLPKYGNNERVELALRYSPNTGKVCLKVFDIEDGKAHEIEDVVSFYINKYGYAYVTNKGKVVIPDSERFNMYSLQSVLRYFQDKHIVAVTCSDNEGLNYDIICSMN